MRRLTIATALVLTLGAGAARAATLPAGFSETFVSGFSSPTAMAVAPDGRVFVCEQGGDLRVIKNGALLATPFLSLTVDSAGERGLLGVAFDPNFVTNQYVYVYYTVPGSPAHNRVRRYTADGDVALSGSGFTLLDLNDLSSATNHNGGALHFGLDGKLYIAVGENASPSNAQTLTNLLGKVLRINSDGSIPLDNPFVGVAGAREEIWALGLRNPFSFAVQPFSGRIFINDVGQSTWEEIDDGASGANYGWPTCEGDCVPQPPPSGITDPFYFYSSHTGTPCAITGGDFYNPQTPQFPASYTGDYFYADYCGDWIKRIDTVSGAVTDFATGISAPVDIHVDFEGNLHYLARGTGRVYKVVYTGTNAPVITENPQSQLRSVGATATFFVAASGAAPLTYQWQKNSSNIGGATSPSYTTPALSLGDSGNQYRCVVSNGSGSATSTPAVLTVTTNQTPTATISSPASGATYAGGSTINYSGSGSDPEDGSLPADALTWWVNFHHDTHTHPVIPPTSGSTAGSFVVPPVGETSPNVWYRIHLSVIDSVGLTAESFRDVVPRTTTMTFTTSPAGLQLKLDGQPFTAPSTVVGVEGMIRNIEAPSPQGGNAFQSWSDGGARIHDITTPVNNTTYTATFAGGPTPTHTFTATRTPTRTNTRTPSRTPTNTPSRTPTFTASQTPTNTFTASRTPTRTRTNTRTPSRTPTFTASQTPTNTFTASRTPTRTRTNTRTPSRTPTFTASQTPTHTFTASRTPTRTRTNTRTPSRTPTSTASQTPTNTFTASRTPTRTRTQTRTPSPTPTNTPSRTPTPPPGSAGVTAIAPSSGPASAGTNVTITGTNFVSGAAVTLGGASLTSIVYVDSTHIKGKTPSRPAGSLQDVIVTNPGGLPTVVSGMLSRGWLSDFSDVPQVNPFHEDVESVFRSAVTAGCGTGVYCPTMPVTRAQMAVFLLKSEHGSSYDPPACQGQFGDVPCSNPFADWIEQLAAEGITAGCGGGNYCPDAAVTREQMAVFLLKTQHGAAYTPPACAGVFDDVPCPSTYARWIERLSAEGITAGCGGDNYCPDNPVGRGPMATFLAKTFDLPGEPFSAVRPARPRILNSRP